MTAEVRAQGELPIIDIRVCGCWVLRAGRGYTVVLCEKHEGPVLAVVHDSLERKKADHGNGNADQA